MTRDELAARLVPFLASRLGVERVSVSDLHRLPGGASRETWSLDATYEKEGAEMRLPLVLRRDPGPTVMSSSRRDEFVLLDALHRDGVPVPRPYWLGDETDTVGARFFLMERVEGETIARRLLRDAEYEPARGVMTAQLGAILASIHRLDWKAHGLDFLPAPPDGAAPAPTEVDRYEQIFRSITPEPHPAFEIAFRWLRLHLPAERRPVVVHGDYRIGNVIFGPEGVRSILDWEMAHLGDPVEDLGWLCVRSWRFGNDDKPVGGIGGREELLAAYERAGGAAVDWKHVRFWEVFGNLKWAVICIMQAKTHLDGLVRSVELASLGRRTAEMELELLNLIEGG
jgi:aminoglycoside phosphotransferase (APT) family kinase protein